MSSPDRPSPRLHRSLALDPKPTPRAPLVVALDRASLVPPRVQEVVLLEPPRQPARWRAPAGALPSDYYLG